MLDLTKYNFKQGSKLVVELVNDDLLEGIYYNGGSNRIDLINITIYSNNYQIKGPYSYYRSEIKSIKNIKEKNGEEKVDAQDKSTDNIILISKQEYEDLRKITRNFIYLPMIDVNYYEAIKYLQRCENLGITAITELFDKFAQLSLLVISSWDQVYIFDVLTYGITKDIKDILESPYILKVAHDSRLLWGVLKNQYKIDLSNIFDTMCADVAIQEKENVDNTGIRTRTIGECFKNYFNFPESFVNIYKNIKIDKWDKRPLSDTRKLQASQLTAYLVYLKNHLEQIMLRKFFETSSRFASTFHIPVKYNNKADGELIMEIEKKIH